MKNSKQLRYEAGRIYQKSQAKMDAANKSKAKAEAFERNDDIARADAETSVSNKLYNESLHLSKIAMKYDSDATELEARALQLESQSNKLQQMLSRQIDDLALRQRALRGDT